MEYGFETGIESLVMDFDRDKVDKVIYNLLSNAFKYTDRGGRVDVILGMADEDGRSYVSVKVADNGIGMEEETVKKLFGLFYQSSDRESRFRGGSGLGLNMTKELLTLMGGRISVESRVGEGSTFTVLLPVLNRCDRVADEHPLPAEIPDAEQSRYAGIPSHYTCRALRNRICRQWCRGA